MRLEVKNYEALHNGKVYYIDRILIRADGTIGNDWRLIDIHAHICKEAITLDQAKDYILSQN